MVSKMKRQRHRVIITAVVLAFMLAAMHAGGRPLPDWLLINGELRLRFEAFEGEDFDDTEDDPAERSGVIGENDEWLLTRLHLNIDAHVNEYLRLYLTLASAHLFEDEHHESTRPSTRWNWEQDRLDIFEAYADLKLQPGIHLKLGRQVLQYGSGRYLAEYDYWNVANSFNAVRLQVRRRTWEFDAVVAQYVVTDDGNLNDTDDSYSGRAGRIHSGTWDDDTIYGAFVTWPDATGTTLELYGFARENANQDSHVYTLGTRVYGMAGIGWDYEAELMVQPGDERYALDHRAWAATAVCGYTWYNRRHAPRLFAGYDYASGDKNVTDTDNEGFDQVYDDGFTHLGYQEFFRRYNLHAVHAGMESHWPHGIVFVATLHSFWVDNDDDQWKNWYRRVVRAEDDRDADNHIGTELDLTLSMPLRIHDRDLDILARYSHFFSGQFVEDANGVADDAHEITVTITHEF